MPLNLGQAWRAVRRRAGAPGIDGLRVRDVALAPERYLLSLQQLLLLRRYESRPLRQVEVRKAGGGIRVLSIPSVLDRIVGRAILNVIAPDLEETFSDRSFAFRRGRSAQQAVQLAIQRIHEGAHWGLKTDIAKYFDTIQHDILLGQIRSSFEEEEVADLLERFVRSEEPDIASAPRLGVPQGSVLSPLFANLYLTPVDLQLEADGFDVFRYADDLLCLVGRKRDAHRACSCIKQLLEPRGLALNTAKTHILPVKEGIDFLGFRLDHHGASIPSTASERLRRTVRGCLRRPSRGRLRHLCEFTTSWLSYYRPVVHRSEIEAIETWTLTQLVLRTSELRHWAGLEVETVLAQIGLDQAAEARGCSGGKSNRG